MEHFLELIYFIMNFTVTMITLFVISFSSMKGRLLTFIKQNSIIGFFVGFIQYAGYSFTSWQFYAFIVGTAILMAIRDKSLNSK